MANTRQSREIFLIGLCELNALTCLKQLPKTKQVLKRFHQHLKDTRDVRNASLATSVELLGIWEKAAIPTMLKTHVTEKIEDINKKWLLLKKNKGRKS